MNRSPENAPEEAADPTLLAEKLIRGEMTPAQYLGMPLKALYLIAERGWHLLQAGRIPQALDIFQGLVAASPHDSVFHCQLGATLMTLERFDEAFVHYQRSVELNVANVDALVGRGELFLRRGDVPAALADLSQALELDPQCRFRSTQRARITLLTLKQQSDRARGQAAALSGARPPPTSRP